LPSTPTSPLRVPNVTRIERLIHIELSDKRAIKDKCSNCGREHREWFEIDATRQGLRSVDEVVRRWVGWRMRQNGNDADKEKSAGEVGMKEKESERQRQSQRERNLHEKAWENADRTRDDAWRDTNTATRVSTSPRAGRDASSTPALLGNERGGYY
jgi:hypothetical protein